MCKKKVKKPSVTPQKEEPMDSDEEDIYIVFLDAASDGNLEGIKEQWRDYSRWYGKKMLLFTDGDKNTALHLTAMFGHYEIVVFLLI
jgi:hypothetical protein